MNGIIYYNETEFVYTIENYKLILNKIKVPGSDIPYADFMKFMSTVVSQDESKDIPKVLNGFDFTTNKKVKFFLTSMHQTKIDKYECSFFSYLLYKEEISDFNRIQIEDSILTHFYLHTHSDIIENSFDTDENAYRTKLKKIPDKFQFQINHKNIEAQINSIFSFHSAKIQKFSIKTFLSFKFMASDEFSFIDDLLFNINEFICFITNKSTYKVLTTDVYKDTKKVGTYVLNGSSNTTHFYEEEIKTIPFDHIKEALGELFNNIANTKIYTGHIKESEFDSKILTYSRIIMLAAGFEWQFNYLNYPIGKDIQKKVAYKDTLDSYLDEKIEQTTGKEKGYFKDVKRLISRDLESLSLAKKIRYALESHEEILSPFISQLWKLNSLPYPTMYELSESIADTRNIIAHGNLSKELSENTVLEYKILQYLYYSMILNSLRVPVLDIQKSIKYLFKVNISLE